MVLVAACGVWLGSVAAEGCCSTCLAQPLVAGIDALNWTACAATQSVCCFDDFCQASTFGAPDLALASVAFVGGQAQIPSGSWFQLTWPSASTVNYMVLKRGQPKTAQVLNTSLAARFKDNYFAMCASVPGVLYYRGFAANGCRASQEMAVQIVPGNGSECSAVPAAPASSIACDPVRGAIKNGVCVCIADNAGPPQCLSNSPTKMVGEYVGIAGAAMSIVGVLYGFYRQQHSKKKPEETLGTIVVTPAMPKKEPEASHVVHLGDHHYPRDHREYSF
ncbi:hypothetical protein ACHHYP_04921 [Achlya hypogyna]|uniref:Secreted protein n=1 Tax=Achlya hypogyna TaxID=1202772 RepID=A0A1V9Z076_ACHHY|nr:hypothetical protein ACHHYP_04921 [Achlya hypogyna]